MKNVYNREVAIDAEHISELIEQLDFSFPQLKELIDNKFDKSDQQDKKYFYIGAAIGIVGIIVGFLPYFLSL